MRAIITYHKDKQHLAVLLTLLQAQMVLPEEIIIIDTSSDKSGLEIARKFSANNEVKIKVECAQVGIYEAWNKGINLANGSDVVIMNDDLLIPINFIDVLGLVSINTSAYCIVPNTPKREHYSDKVDVSFPFYARLPETPDDISISDWMPGFCFYLSNKCVQDVGIFDESHFKCWFGDNDYEDRLKKVGKKNNIIPILKINSMFIYHFGGKSYQYQNKEVQSLINKDRKAYAKKHPNKIKKSL